MPRGRQTRTLRPDQIKRLEAFKRAPHDGAPHGYSLPQLRSAMALGCSWETLQKALQGLPVWDMHHTYIAEWIERYLPAAPAAVDGKAAASGEREEAAASGEKSSEEAVSTKPVPSSSQRDTGTLRHAASEEVSDVKPNEEEAGTNRTVRGSR
jgi:hypothetical protein